MALASMLPVRCGVSETQLPKFLDGPARLPASPWMHGAAVGGVELYVEIESDELETLLDTVAEQGITVAELDSDLSHYLDDAGFAAQLELLDAAARRCHARGIHAVAYYPSLEVLTAGADKADTRTMARDNPDWLQIDLLNTPSVFIGGEGRVFWVDPDTESAWMCPLTGYADYYLDRIRKLASTALDGVWPDVPLLSDIAATWPCTDPACRARFHADTGHHLPTWVEAQGFRRQDGSVMSEAEAWPNFDDPVFRRWVHWRHDVVSEFEQRIVDAARSVRDDFEVIVETVTMDYSGATIQGLDAAWAAPGALRRVWEVDAVSDDTGMRPASARDWLSMAVMMKHGRGCLGDAPSWTFCYGRQSDDAERVFGLAVATHNSPFEARIPDMLTTVGGTHRQTIFGHLKRLGPYYQGSRVSRVGVLYSPSSRDLLDRSSGVGLYTELDGTDELWWTDYEPDLAHQLPYLADYRGLCGALMQLHEVFDVITPAFVTAEWLADYDVLLLPSAVAASDAFVEVLGRWVDGGGTLLMTGETPGLYDLTGAQRATPRLAAALGVTPSDAWTETPLGSGRTIAITGRAGQQWYAGYPDADTGLAEHLLTVFDQYRTPPLRVDAPATVLLDARRGSDGALWVSLGNLTGLGGASGFDPQPADATLRVAGATQAVVYRLGVAAEAVDIDGEITVRVDASTVVALS